LSVFGEHPLRDRGRAVAGDLELTGEALQLPGDAGLTIIAYTFEPASPTEQALAFLDSWSAREAAVDGSDRG
jgi:transcription regulator MmyB-like protein